ncbi:hypothetical protein FHX81_4822 [Saccharothrix saharensis]|uniref:Uncharacterized protein n=1 Tax=Saccharothrix saharensis TaxID=571190 RepID=A0A543JHU5_9PSEU|nr:hypothetical protein [Saccharothrix saharensis]TQM82418.1 hypothetical protein FHX81_4822 [Saccharothrix saharensis]
MSSLFGQVWLWSLLSFVAGVALTWFVLVRPAKKELEDLEERLLTSPRPASGPSASAPVASVAPKADAVDDVDNWHVEAQRSLADDVLTPEPARYEVAAERPRFDATPEPVRYDVSNLKLDQRDALLEELDDEHRPLSDFEEQHDFPELDAEPPRSLFDRLAPGQDTRETLEPKPRPRSHQPEDEPELPAEATTHLMPAVPAGPVAEVAPRQEEPTAPPEVEVFQPREVWREEPVKEVYDEDVDTGGHEEEDEPERRPGSTETTALIPATALAQAIAEVDGERRTDEPEPQVWPEHDLTGHFAPVDVESARGELSAPAPTPSDEAFLNDLARRQDEARPAPEVREEEEGPHTDVIRAVDSGPAEPEPESETTPEPEPEPEPEPAGPEPEAVTPEPEPRPEPPAFEPTFVPQSADQPLPARQPEHRPEPKKDEPARPRSLFEPLEDDEQVPELEQPRPTPSPSSSGNDQPFVPTLAPELLAGNPVPMNPTGLPQRPTRPAGTPRTPPPAPPAPKPVTPPPPRPVRPRPVGFSPSTGGRPAPGSTRFQGQQEGFNPRSPFGPGSVLPKSDGLAPAPEFQVKATLTGRRYFTNESANFRETRADVWFRTTADAEKAGFRQAP